MIQGGRIGCSGLARGNQEGHPSSLAPGQEAIGGAPPSLETSGANSWNEGR